MVRPGCPASLSSATRRFLRFNATTILGARFMVSKLRLRRQKIIDEMSRDSTDHIVMDAVNYCALLLPCAEDEYYEYVTKIYPKMIAQEKKRHGWLYKLFPRNEMWRMPTMTAILLEEVGMCYVKGIYYATVVMVQAAIESLLRRMALKASLDPETKYSELTKKLRDLGMIKSGEWRSLKCLSDIRNPVIHTGKPKKYAMALSKAVVPVVKGNQIIKTMQISYDSKRAVELLIRFLHNHCACSVP